MNPIDRLTEKFKRFPGIGPRQARRFVYFLLSQNESYVNDFLREITELRKKTVQCPICYIYFTKDNFSEYCDVCMREDTDTKSLLIVAKDVDVEAIKKTGVYKGRYFVLGGTLPFLEKKPDDFIRINELARHVQKNPGLKEVIFALPVTPEGDNTRKYIEDILPLDISLFKTLGRGLSTGTELEYSDTDTIISAFKNRY